MLADKPNRWVRLVAWLTPTLAAIIWVCVALPSRPLESIDERWRALMAAWEWPPAVGLATFLSWIGSVWVMAPLEILVAIGLRIRKRRRAFWIWVLSVASAELIKGATKLIYQRPRPDDRLLEPETTSFPSGHTTSAAVVGLALVFILARPGSRRRWFALAIAYAGVMALSRTYLRVHWLTDVTGGFLLGTTCAIWGAWGAARMPVDSGAPGARS